MATTTNYSWTTPDDTDLVKDGAAAIRTLGTAIDSTVFTNAGAAINKSLVDAAGDLIYGTADNTVARLAIGTAGQLLKVNSGATAPEWGTVSTNKTYTLLNTGGTTLSGSASVVVNVTTKEDYYILVIGASCGSRQDMQLRINGDTGSNYITTVGNIDAESAYSANNFSSSGTTGTLYRLSTMSSNAASTMNAGIYVGAGNSTTLHPVEWQGSATPSGGNAHSIYIGTGFYSGSAAITSFTILSAANFDAGTVYVYGA
jgi:hypothetical protein